MTCEWCRREIPPRHCRGRFCSQRCRQAAWRFRDGVVARERADEPRRWAYADPPYPGLARRYYRDHPDYAGEVDHLALLSRLRAYDGWAVSTSADGLPMVLGHARDLGLDVAVAAWFRGARAVPSSRPLHAWEPVIYSGARPIPEPSREYSSDASLLEPRRVDALVHVSRPRTTDPDRVVGAKPARFAYWLFELLGMRPGDHLEDLFPGSGGVGRAWEVFVSAGRDASPPGGPDVSAGPGDDASG